MHFSRVKTENPAARFFFHYYSEKAKKFEKSPPYFRLALHRTKVRWRFAKFCGLLRIYEL